MKEFYQCVRCNYVGSLDKFGDVECDGDIIGTCPNCKKNRILLEVFTAYIEFLNMLRNSKDFVHIGSSALGYSFKDYDFCCTQETFQKIENQMERFGNVQINRKLYNQDFLNVWCLTIEGEIPIDFILVHKDDLDLIREVIAELKTIKEHTYNHHLDDKKVRVQYFERLLEIKRNFRAHNETEEMMFEDDECYLNENGIPEIEINEDDIPF